MRHRNEGQRGVIMGSYGVRVMSACPTDSSSTGRSSRLSGTCPSRPACDPPPRTLCFSELPRTWAPVAVPLASTAVGLGRLGTAAVPVLDRGPQDSLDILVGGNPGAGIPVVGSPVGEEGPGVGIPGQLDRRMEGAAQSSSLWYERWP